MLINYVQTNLMTPLFAIWLIRQLDINIVNESIKNRVTRPKLITIAQCCLLTLAFYLKSWIVTTHLINEYSI